MEKKAVVLCGGGAKGAYQIGALMALKKIGFKPDIVTGTSVGALNGCFAVMDDLKLGYDVWSNINMSDIFSFNDKQKDISSSKSMLELTAGLIKSGSGASYEPLMNLIEKYVDEDKIRKSKIEFGFVTTQFMPLKKVEIYKEDIPNGQLKDYVMASAACYPYMKSYSINNKKYIDGGYFDNMPIEMAIKKGADNIVVIDLKGIGKIQKTENLPAKITYVGSRHNLGGIMLFNSDNSIRNIELGYLDTLKAFNILEGDFYAFKKGENIKASKYEEKIFNIYKKIFSSLPTASSLESLADKSINNYLNDYNRELFYINSNVLTISEMLANIFKIDYLKTYTIRSLTKKINKSVKDYKKENQISDFSDIKKILSGVLKAEKLKDTFDAFDKRNIVLYIDEILSKNVLSSSEKKEIWLIATAFPDIVLASIFLRTISELKFLII